MKKAYVIFLIMVMTISVAPQTFATSTQSTDPFASDSEISFNIVGGLNYDYCNDFGYIWAIITSATSSVPDQVIGQLNDNNYTMTAPLFLPDGWINNKQFKQGIYYHRYIGQLATGQYNLTIHAKKGEQTVSSSQISYEINSTLQIENGWIFDDVIRLDHYKYLFSLDFWDIETKCISQAIITINGTNYTMIRDDVLGNAEWDLLIDNIIDDPISGQFFYIHEFSPVDLTQEVEYNFTIVFADGQTKFWAGDTIKIYKELEISSLTAYSEIFYLSDYFRVLMKPKYFDGKNRPLQGLIITINGTNTTINPEPYAAEYMDTVLNGFRKPIYAAFNELDMPEGERLKDFVLDLEYGKTYSISIWYNNGSWIEIPLFAGTIPPKTTDIPEPIVEYQNLESGMNATHCWVSGLIKIYSSWPGFSIGGTSFPVVATTGEIQTAGVAIQMDPGDTDYTDGKFFKFNITLWETGEYYWGDVIINYSFYYGNATIGYGYEFNRYSGSKTIERLTPEKAGTYIKPTKPLVYSVYTKEKLCCGPMITTKNQTEIYNMVAFEKAFRGDRIVFNKTYIFNSIALNRNNINVTMVNASKQLIITGGPDLYLGDAVISTDAVSTLNVIVNAFPLEPATTAKISKDFLTSLTTIYYEEKLGDLTIKVKYVYDEKGVLRLFSVQNLKGETLIYESVMELQMSLMDTILEDYLMVIIIGGVALIGIIVVVTVIIKKRKA